MGLLSWIVIIPALGAILMIFIPSRDAYKERASASIYGWIALVVSSVAMLVSIFLLTGFDNSLSTPYGRDGLRAAHQVRDESLREIGRPHLCVEGVNQQALSRLNAPALVAVLMRFHHAK